MRIAIVTHNVLRGDGQGRVNFEFVSYLLRNGHSVELFADAVEDVLVEMGATWTRVQPGFEGIDLLKVWRFKRMADVVVAGRANEFDAIVACGVVLGIRHDLNVAHFVHGTWLRSPYHASKVRRNLNGWYQWLFSTMNARWEKRVFAQAHRVGSVSRMVSEELKSIGVDPKKIVLLGNGVDVDEYRPGVESRAELKLPVDVPLGLFVGDIQSPIKNLDAVLRALVSVPGLHLAVAGRPGSSPYPALAKRLGIDDRVHFLGFRRDIAALMRACDFFALVSRRDSCPLVVLEAISSGLPVITSRTVGNHDLVLDCCGFVIDTPDSADQLEVALRRLTLEPELRRDMSERARARALENTWDRMSARYVQALTELKSVDQPESA